MTETQRIRVRHGWIIGGHAEGAEFNVPRRHAEIYAADNMVDLIDDPAPAPEPDRTGWPLVRLVSECVDGAVGDVVQVAPDRADWLLWIGAARDESGPGDTRV